MTAILNLQWTSPHDNQSPFHKCVVRNKDFTIQTKKGGKDQESVQLSTTPDPGYQMGK